MYSPKICRIRRRNFISIVCKICRYYRDGHGRPTHEVLKAFPTVRSNSISDPATRKFFWMDVELSLLRFLVSKVITPTEAERIRNAFEAVIPKPAKPLTVPVAKPVERTSKADLIARFPILASGK